jgi:hypothetical protein
MKTDWLKILLIFLLLFTACRRSDSSRSSGLGILNSDQTQEAVDKVNEANNDLKKIKAIYKASEEHVEGLKAAIENKEVEKVRKAAGELVLQLNEGMELGNNVISKIEEAGEMNINETYKEYLDLKAQALRKQLEAFEIRFEQVKYFRDEFQVSNTQEIEKAKAVLMEKDESFKKKMEAAREYSRQANLLAKENTRKKE